MNKVYKYIAFLIISVALLFSCKKDFDKPAWDIEVLAPLAKTTMDINNLIADSLIKVEADSSVVLVYQETLEQINLDSLMIIPDSTYTFSTTLDSIKLGTITVVEHTSLGELALKDIEENGIGGIGTLLIAADAAGVPILVTAIDSLSLDNVEINATQWFETMTLSKGVMDIEIENNYPIDITNVSFELRNAGTLELIASKTFPSIPAGTTVTDTASLDGKTVNGNLIANITNMQSPGSTDSVYIDTSDAVITTIRVRDLIPFSAVAVFPTQNILNKSENEKFGLDDVQLTKIIARQGFVKITAYNTVEDPMYFEYILAGASINDVPLHINAVIPGASGGQPGVIDKYFDLTGYTLDLRGAGYVEQERYDVYGYSSPTDLDGDSIISPYRYNTFFYTMIGRIDSTGNIINLSLADSFYVDVGLVDLIPEYAYGHIKQRNEQISGQQDIDIFKKVTSGSLDLDDVNIALEISNEVGVEAELQINEIRSQNSKSGASTVLSVPASNNPMNVIKPDDPNSTAIPVTAAVSALQLSKSNSNTPELIEIMPDIISYNIDVSINPNFPTPPPIGDGDDFIYYGTSLNADLNIEIPLNFVSDKLTLQDTADFKLGDPNVDNIAGGNLTLYIDNGFPMDATIQLYLLDTTNVFLDSLMTSGSFVPAANINTVTGKVESPRSSKLTIPVSEAKLEDIIHAGKIVFIAQFTSIPQNRLLKIYSNYMIDFKLTADFKYRIR